MNIDEDWLREERIQRLRALVRSGVKHLVFLHEAIPFYLRQGQAAEERVGELVAGTQGQSFRSRLSPESLRDHEIAIGMFIDNRQHRAFDKIYKWVSDVNDVALRTFLDERFKNYQVLGDPPQLPTNHDETGAAERGLAELTADIRSRVLVITEALSDLGEHEDVAPAIRDAPGGWPHLRGLVADSVIDGHLRQMRVRRTRAEISSAIGASKEIVEATFKALSLKYNVTPSKIAPDLSDWWKVLRPLLADQNIDKALGSKDGALIKLVSSQVSLVHNLGELRNKIGSGHGKAEHPAGLGPSHALLAVDTAHTLTRFLAH
ncbi:abortive infection family protein [Arthrobacter sp. GMC3]|uniref:abortive infection family protein n=1 Tax=Arthrobacter sp. GMC3 TaxID=2058894 RepID=UPI000CE3F0BB|nr:abortive infection family protein [Arthrobacter sp. GMC3]